MLRSDFCVYSDAYIIVAKGRITFEGDNNNKTRNKKLVFKKNELFNLGHK